MLTIIGLLLAFTTAVLVLNRWHDFAAAMLAGSVIMALTGGFTAKEAVQVLWSSLSNPSTLKLVAVVVLINLMGYILKKTGSLENMVKTMLKVLRDFRLVVIAIPALVGLLPVPGGAVMSAPLVAEAGKKAGLSPEKQVAANVLFRHLLYLVFPLYSAMILANDLSGIGIDRFARHQLLPMLVGFVTGFIFLFRGGKPAGEHQQETGGEKWLQSLLKFLYYASPIIVTLLLVILLRLNFILAVGLGILLALLQGIKNYGQLQTRIRQYLLPGLDWKLALAILNIMIFRGYVQGSGAVDILAQYLDQMGVPILLLAVIFPVLTGIATGSSLAVVGILFPIFIPLVPAGMDSLDFLSLIFIGTMVGYLISPIHMCLVLTREVCQARFSGSYPYLLPPLLAMLLVSIIMVLI